MVFLGHLPSPSYKTFFPSYADFSYLLLQAAGQNTWCFPCVTTAVCANLAKKVCQKKLDTIWIRIAWRLLKNMLLVYCCHSISWNVFQHSKISFISPRIHVITSIYWSWYLVNSNFLKLIADIKIPSTEKEVNFVDLSKKGCSANLANLDGANLIGYETLC